MHTVKAKRPKSEIVAVANERLERIHELRAELDITEEACQLLKRENKELRRLCREAFVFRVEHNSRLSFDEWAERYALLRKEGM